MEQLLEQIKNVNDTANGFIWGTFGIIFLLGTGIVCTIVTKCPQITRFGHIVKNTFGQLFKKDIHKKMDNDPGTLSQFQAVCTGLAAVIGTGNIAGVSTAICLGGPGAVFWMWIAAFFGMVTRYCENVLGVYFRRKNRNKEWSGGVMYYLKDGLGRYPGFKTIGRILAALFCVFTILASFGTGNMAQINKITLNVQSAFFSNVEAPAIAGVSVVNWAIGLALMILGGFIVFGGLKRIAAFSVKVVPITALVYVIGCLIVILSNISVMGDVFSSIFHFAFVPRAAIGGIAGSLLKSIIDGPVKNGCKRGIFSNEAGLGSTVMVHSNSSVKEPVRQGMWGIFEVFVDTIVVCTMTALVVLSSGAIDLKTGFAAAGTNDATLVSTAFSNVFGQPGEWFIAVIMLIFAFTTVVGWSQYGSKVTEYLFGEKIVKYYRLIFVLTIIFGAVLEPSLAWDVSDTFNGLMMIPNLIGILALIPLVAKITKNYRDRRIRKMSISPMLSYDPYLQEKYENEG